MPPPMMSLSTFGSIALMTSIFPETFAPPNADERPLGRLRWPRPGSRLLFMGPDARCGSWMPDTELWSRWAVPNASLT
jgi:hypothetical protein